MRERVETIIGPLGACHLGAVTLELGKAPTQTPGDADVLELERGDEDAARRVLRLLGRTGADGQRALGMVLALRKTADWHGSPNRLAAEADAADIAADRRSTRNPGRQLGSPRVRIDALGRPIGGLA